MQRNEPTFSPRPLAGPRCRKARPIARIGPIELETLRLAIGAARTGPGRHVRWSATSPSTAARFGPGTLYFCVRGSAPTVTTTRRRRSRAGAVALVVERRLDLPVPQLARRGCARRDGARGGRLLPAADGELAVAACHGHEREDDHGVPALRDARRRRTATGAARYGREPRRRRAPGRVQHTTPEAIDLQRDVPGDARRGRPQLRDGGVLARGRAAPARLRSLPCARVHEPDAGSPRLPRHDGGLLRREAAALPRAGTRRAAARPRPSTSATRTDAGWPRSLRGSEGRLITFGFAPDADVRPEALELTQAGAAFQADGLRRSYPPARPLQRRERPRRRRRRAAARASGRRDRAGRRASAGSARAGSRRSTRASRSPCSSTTRTRRTRSRTCSTAAREICAGRLVCVFGCGGDRDRGKRPLMGAVAARLADRVIVTSDNPRSEEPLAIIDEILAGSRAGPALVEVEPDRRAAIRPPSRTRRGRRGRDRREGARAGADPRRPHRCRSPTARKRATRCDGSPQEPPRDPARARRGRASCARAGSRRAGGAQTVTGLEIDSRRVGPGDLFVAIRGGVDHCRRRAGAGRGGRARAGRRARGDGGAREGRA